MRTFALSPIDPVGFVGECQRLGLLAIPSAFTSNECWALHRRGVRLIKLFHAGLASPAILKSMLAVTPLGEHLNILPSGGVSPDNAEAWWAAGAAVIGMGSNLVGNLKDLPDGGKWAAGGRETAGEAARLSAQHRQLGGRERPFEHHVAVLEEGGEHALHCGLTEPRESRARSLGETEGGNCPYLRASTGIR